MEQSEPPNACDPSFLLKRYVIDLGGNGENSSEFECGGRNSESHKGIQIIPKIIILNNLAMSGGSSILVRTYQFSHITPVDLKRQL